MLYSGEQFDPNLQMQYLRARYYDQNAGVFNRLDPFNGNIGDPQSLHKYAYCHGNPVMGIDPSGLYTLAETINVSAIITVLSTLLGGALFMAAGKGGVRGAISGVVFGVGLSLAIFSPDKVTVKKALGKALLALLIMVGVDLLFSLHSPIPRAEIVFDAFEAFGWTLAEGFIPYEKYDIPLDSQIIVSTVISTIRSMAAHVDTVLFALYVLICFHAGLFYLS